MYRNELIKGKMAELGFTIETLKQKTGLSADAINRARSGGNTNIETLKKIAEALEIPMPKLFESKETESTERLVA